MPIVEGSTSLMAPSGSSRRLPTRRIVGSSSSSTTITLYGANSAKAGSSGGWGTTNDQIRPRPDIGAHLYERELQYGHMGRGGKRRRPQLEHRWMRSSPAAVPSQNPA